MTSTLRDPYPSLSDLKNSSIYLFLAHPEPHYPPSSLSREARRCHLSANKAYGWAAYIFLDVPPPPPPQSLLPPPRPPLSTANGSSMRYDAEFAVSRKQ